MREVRGKLFASGPTQSRQRSNRAAVTVTMFTGLFLVCALLYQQLPGGRGEGGVSLYSYPGPLFTSSLMFWFSWPFSKILCCTTLGYTCWREVRGRGEVGKGVEGGER